jgi:hypothetical protein
MKIESGYRANAHGRVGEIGLMQVMPPTARLLGFSGDDEALADPETNIRLGARYLPEAWRLANGDLRTALMKCRAGHSETRFSVLSVRYCIAVRTHLAHVGHPVTGDVPEPTFSFRADQFRMGVADRHATGGATADARNQTEEPRQLARLRSAHESARREVAGVLDAIVRDPDRSAAAQPKRRDRTGLRRTGLC